MRIDPISFFGAVEGWRSGDGDRPRKFLAEAPRWRRSDRECFYFDLLVWSLMLGEEGFAAALVDAGLPVSSRDTRRQTPLLFFTERDNPGAVRLLLEKGADPTEGLVCAVQCCNLELVDLFLAENADIGAINDDAVSLVRVHADVLRHLVAAGARMPDNILEMLANRTALGDSGSPSLPERRRK